MAAVDSNRFAGRIATSITAIFKADTHRVSGGLPGAPTNIDATLSGSTATVTWSAPSADGGFPITSYRVTTYPGGAINDTVGVALTLDITGLSVAPHVFTVSAINIQGTGSASVPSPIVYEAAAAGGAAFNTGFN